MNNSIIDTCSVTFPITFFRKFYRDDAARLYSAMVGKLPANFRQDNRAHLLDGDFCDWAAAFDVLPADLWSSLMCEFLYQITGVVIEVDDTLRAGRNMFRNSMNFSGGWVAWGGNNVVHQADGLPARVPERVQVYFNAEGCERYLRGAANARLHDALLEHDGRITRIDVAFDMLDGQCSILDGIAAYEAGEFTITRPPKAKHVRDLSGAGDGETLYIGNRANGKMLRLYEKGKQLGDSSSLWTRCEVELGSRDRVIDPAILLHSDQGFIEAYPFCARIMAEYGSTVSEVVERRLVVVGKLKLDTTVEALINHARRGYGALINLLSRYGMTDEVIVERLRRAAVPRRVEVLVPC